LKFTAGHPYELYDVLNGNQRIALDGDTLKLDNQPSRSVKLIKIIDGSISAAAPSITMNSPKQGKMGETINFSAAVAPDSVPATDYLWDFSDGVTVRGSKAAHAYTREGKFEVHLRVDGVDGIPADKNASVAVSGEAQMSPPRRYVQPTD
jgi:hypothetical protein